MALHLVREALPASLRSCTDYVAVEDEGNVAVAYLVAGDEVRVALNPRHVTVANAADVARWVSAQREAGEVAAYLHADALALATDLRATG